MNGRFDQPYTAGMTRVRAEYGSASRRLLPVSLWYPSHAPETPRLEGIINLSASFDAKPADGRFGLILISHGSGGSDINHHDWAEVLARAGFVVAAPRHLGDSHDLNFGLADREQLLSRPRQLRAALDAALADSRVGGCIDAARMGVVGFSAGGYTALVLLGARPDIGRWPSYCRRHPDSQVICPGGGEMDLVDPGTDAWRGLQEPRLRAGVLLAPFAMLFGKQELERVRTPIRLYRAADENIARNESNADAVADALPTRPEIVTVPGNHYVFIAPVSEAVAAKYPEFYIDKPGVDRTAIHRRIGLEMVDFFRRELGQPQ